MPSFEACPQYFHVSAFFASLSHLISSRLLDCSTSSPEKVLRNFADPRVSTSWFTTTTGIKQYRPTAPDYFGSFGLPCYENKKGTSLAGSGGLGFFSVADHDQRNQYAGCLGLHIRILEIGLGRAYPFRHLLSLELMARPFDTHSISVYFAMCSKHTTSLPPGLSSHGTTRGSNQLPVNPLSQSHIFVTLTTWLRNKKSVASPINLTDEFLSLIP